MRGQWYVRTNGDELAATDRSYGVLGGPPLVTTVGVLALLCGGLVASPQSKEVRAGRFVLVESEGRERAELGILPDGGTRLVLRGQGKAAAYVGIRADGLPLIAMAGSNGQPVAELAIMDRDPLFVLRDPDGGRRIAMVVRADGPAGLVVHDAQGREVWRAPEKE